MSVVNFHVRHEVTSERAWDALTAFDPVAEEQRHRFFGLEWFLDEEERPSDWKIETNYAMRTRYQIVVCGTD